MPTSITLGELPITLGRTTTTTSTVWVCLLRRISVSTTTRHPTTCIGRRPLGRADSRHKISGSKITLEITSNGIRTTIISGIIKATTNLTHNKTQLLILGGLTMAITISGGHKQVSISEAELILQTTGCKITIIIKGWT